MSEQTKRQRSHWGWGWADRWPEANTRRQLGQMANAMLGFDAPALMDPVPLAEVAFPEARLRPPEALAHMLTDAHRPRIMHTYGRAYPDIVRGFRGDFTSAPDLVAHPSSAEDVRRLLDWASAQEVAVIPFGGGTSVVGGVNSAELEGSWRGCVAMDMARMRQVTEVDAVSQCAHIEAGAFGPDLEDQLGAHGLTLRHYPQSFEFSTLGGWIATRSGGHFATVYTHIEELVHAVRMITPSGEWATRRVPASGAGPDPTRLIAGSEGALGVITDAWMRVRPRPRFVAKADVMFEEFQDAVDAARQIAQTHLHPTNCRILDAREAALNQLNAEGKHLLLLGFESAHHPVRWPMEQALEIARGCGGVAPRGIRHTDRDAPDEGGDGGSTAGQWKSAFFDGPYLQSTLVSLGVLADTFETACTWSGFAELHHAIVSGMRDAMERVCGTRGFISCRFTHVYPDGPAPYYTYIAPIRPGSEIEQWRDLKAASAEILMAHGATITHHHAVGRIHKPWWRDHERADLFGEALEATKERLDPMGVLNPGALI